MSYIITITTAAGVQRYPAIGDIGALQDAAYDAGALGVSAMVQR